LTATAIGCYPSALEGLMQKTAILLVLAVAGCTSSNTTNPPPPPGCRCTNAVPGGTLDLPCGASGCLGGMGYRCLDNDRFEENTTICGFDLSVPRDMAAPPGSDLSIGPDLYGIDLGAPLGCNGVELCASRCTTQACIMLCYDRLTAQGQTLDNNFYSCQVTFCSMVFAAGDAGFACNATDVGILNGTTTGTLTTPCQQCLGSYGFTGVWSTYCASQIAACRADLP
jgi:hypothetical protein